MSAPVVAADLILAIDVGTQSVRALLFDGTGVLVARARIPIQPYVSPHPGWAEQDPELYWQAIGEACRSLWATADGTSAADATGAPGFGDAVGTVGAVGAERAGSPRPIRPDRIAALTLTTQRATVVCLDAAGRPVRPAIVWLDQRRATGLPHLGGLTGAAFRVLRVENTVAAFQADAEVNWLRLNEPDTWAATAHYVLLSGFVASRLTGAYVDSAAAQVGYLPFDYRRLTWAAPNDWKWRVAPIDPGRLPALVRPTERLGELTASAAEHLGLASGLPVIAAAADKACEVLGSGALTPNIGAISFGTTATLNTTQRRYVEAIPLVPPYPSAIPGAYSLEIQVQRGFWLVEWFKREFGSSETARAAALGVEPEALFDELVASTPPGSMGLVLQPTWSPGIRFPGPEAKGAIVGFGDVHTRAHLYRAILEGLGNALRDGAERTERRTGTRITELRISGGGSQSPAAVQLTADLFGLPATLPHTHETSGLGATIDAAVGLGWYASVEEAGTAMVRIGTAFEPDPAAHAIYDELYRRVYRRLYARLRPLYEEIQRITGYPGAV